MAAMAFAACSESEDYLSAYRNDDNAVHFSAQVGCPSALELKSNPIGTETEQAQFSNGDQISVEAGTQKAVVYTFDGTNWTPEQSNYLVWDESGSMEFRAFYPAGKTGASFTTFSMPTSFGSPSDLAGADYMTSKTTATKSDQVNLPMSRQTVRMVIDQITFNDEFPTADYYVSDIKFHATATEIVGGAPQLLTTPEPVTPYKHTDGKYYALLLPNAQKVDKAFITVILTNETDGQATTLDITGIPVTKAGKSYTYRLTIGKKSATVKSVIVNDWTAASDVIKGIFDPVTTSANTETHTVYVANAGELTESLITDAIDNEEELKITGTLSAQDLSTIQTALSNSTSAATVTTVDLSGATLESGTTLTKEIFKDNTTLTSVTLPAGLTTIGDGAFDGCTALTSVTIPTGLTTLGEKAFEGCTALTSVTLPSGLTAIGNEAFNGCTALTSVTIQSGLEEIGEKAFKGCTSLTSIDLGNSLQKIGQEAFSGCTSLASVTFPTDTWEEIGDKAFSGCTSLTYVNLGGLKQIGGSAFEYCTSLTGFSFSGTSISGSAFSGCTSLLSLDGLMVPSLGTFGDGVFSGCTSLTSVNMNINSSGDVFTNCTGLKTATISFTSNGSTAEEGETPDYIFQNCTSLESVTFNSEVKAFGRNVFEGCSELRDLYLNKNEYVPTSVGDNAFQGCSNITLHVKDEDTAKKFKGWLSGVITKVVYPTE